MTAALQLDGVGKRYWQLQEQAMLLRSVLPFTRPKRKELWALRDIDLHIEQGETVGILGRNGAGKTTLLRLLAGVSQPSAGRIQVRGRVAPLIGIGVGFHQEMSGRENVYVNGMLLGLTRAQVDQRFDAIVDFAELEAFIDTPVKFYSSGMFMRLGFSVAAHVDPQIMLVDEVLAVGDIAFQLKCFERMRELKSTGTTVVLVSHSMHAIRLLCPRALLFRGGHLDLDSDSEQVIARHHALMAGEIESSGGGVTVVDRELVDSAGAPARTPKPDEPLTYQLKLRFDRPVESPHVYFDVIAEDGTLAYEMKTVISRGHRSYAAGDVADVEIAFTSRLGGGTYRLLIVVTDQHGRVVLHRDVTGLAIYVAPPLGSGGVAELGASIVIDGELLTDHEALVLDDRRGLDPQ